MSDDNYRKPSSPRATRIGLGLSGADASYDGHPGEPLSGTDRRGASARAVGAMQTGANSGLAEVESDTRYMDPPSETHGVERAEIVRRLGADTEANALRAGSHGLFGSTLRAQTAAPAAPEDNNISEDELQDAAAENPGLFQGALAHTMRAQPVAAQPATPLPPPSTGSRAPEAWRNEVRRMVERAPTKGPSTSQPGASSPSSQQPSGVGGFGGPNPPGGASLPPAHKPSLRLKLDADAVEESAYRAPKSPLPKLLAWLMVLGLLGGGFWLFAESQGGVAALIQKFRGGPPTLTTQQPTAPPANAVAAPGSPAVADPAATGQQPPAAAATAVPAQAQQPAAPTSAPAQPSNTAQPASAAAAAPSGNNTAAPSAPKAAAPTAPAQANVKQAEPTSAPAAQAPKPAAPKPPARAVRPQQPVVKVRPIESPSTAEPAAPAQPDGLDIPYVPMPDEPPAPDEAR